ncbi:DUF1707 SHOCT-like domain-containing protein [Thermostaphylospora chromogena]|nr:DUF1707 domain-containing protein [Thermostaphylospora chromogena]
MRASDADRDRVAGLLREHYAEGRLTVEEFDERLERLYKSKTYGELEVLTADLPGTDLAAYSARADKPAPKDDKKADEDKGLVAAWSAWAAASGVNWVIWLIVSATSDDGGVYPWPLWVMGPWGVILLVSTVAGVFTKKPKSS